MPASARLGDKAKIPADSHGCPSCAHTCIGPAVSGSPSVFINSRAAIRVGDPGVHAACCGANRWVAQQGAPGVFINGKQAHRLDDATSHCGGIGKTIEGSGNVFVGNYAGGGAVAHKPLPPLMDVEFIVLDEEGNPLPYRACTVTGPHGYRRPVRTDKEGRIYITSVPAGEYELSTKRGVLKPKDLKNIQS